MCADFSAPAPAPTEQQELFGVYVRNMFKWAYERSQRPHNGSPPVLCHGIQQADGLTTDATGLSIPAAWIEHDGYASYNFGGIVVVLPIDLYRRLYRVIATTGRLAMFTPTEAAAKLEASRNFGPWELDLANCSRF